MDRILKLVYPYHYSQYEVRKPFYNGIHPTVIEYLKKQLVNGFENFNVDNILEKIVQNSKNSNWHYNCHSNFYYYFLNHFNDYNLIVDENEIVKDGSIYLYPIEIRTTLNYITHKNSLNLNGQTIGYTLIDTIPPKILDNMRNGLVKIIFNIIHDPCVDIKGVLEIEQFFNKHGISGENLIFIWGNNFQKIKVLAPNSKVKFTYGILPLQQQSLSMENFPRTTSLGYVSDIVRENDLNRNLGRKKKFLCFNRTMKPHRYMLAHLALKHKLLEQSTFSFLNSNLNAGDILNQLGVFKKMNPDITLEKAAQIEKMIPYQLDTHALERNQLSGFTTDNNKKEFYLDSYIHLTSETLFEFGDGNNPFFSEKTFRPIQNLQPFIFVGEPYSLRLLHQLGFKTFDPVINESYDLETDPSKRMKMIENEIIRLNAMPMKQLHELYFSLIDICIYNQNHFKTFARTNPFDQVFNDINSFYSKG